MPKLIKDGVIVDDTYTLVAESDDGSLVLPSGPVLVKLPTWRKHRESLLQHSHARGVQLAPDEFAEAVAPDLAHLDLIAIEFPAFADGRGYSTATLLRNRHGYTGELRAVGDVFKDTLFFQQRCGFNAFTVRADKDISDALAGLSTFSVRYQGAVDTTPLFRQRLA
ncbi:MAG: oxidoreductase [Moraxellaceae bacterium]|jgi:uncharacterized protein (DUF934 family)|nr:oxidoreductase [Moraxellaceae bacterium]